jgi:hypothetical protein
MQVYGRSCPVGPHVYTYASWVHLSADRHLHMSSKWACTSTTISQVSYENKAKCYRMLCNVDMGGHTRSDFSSFTLPRLDLWTTLCVCQSAFARLQEPFSSDQFKCIPKTLTADSNVCSSRARTYIHTHTSRKGSEQLRRLLVTRFRGFRLTQLFNSCLLFHSNYPLHVSIVRPSSSENIYLGKMVVRPKHVADNFNKIVNYYWNRVALDENLWTWPNARNRAQTLKFKILLLTLFVVFKMCMNMLCLSRSMLLPATVLAPDNIEELQRLVQSELSWKTEGSTRRSLSQCHFSCHKVHTIWPGTIHWPMQWEVEDLTRFSFGTDRL